MGVLRCQCDWLNCFEIGEVQPASGIADGMKPSRASRQVPQRIALAGFPRLEVLSHRIEQRPNSTVLEFRVPGREPLIDDRTDLLRVEHVGRERIEQEGLSVPVAELRFLVRSKPLALCMPLGCEFTASPSN